VAKRAGLKTASFFQKERTWEERNFK